MVKQRVNKINKGQKEKETKGSYLTRTSVSDPFLQQRAPVRRGTCS